jgi:protein required for attachment to host cells
MEKHNFVHAIVEALKHAHGQHKFERLVVVAPERSIGEFRALAPDSLQKIVTHEVKKELMHLSTEELEQRLTAEMKIEPAP